MSCDAPTEALLCTANPWLNMSGGVNAAILGRGNLAIQEELHAHIARGPTRYVPSGTVVEGWKSSEGRCVVPHRNV